MDNPQKQPNIIPLQQQVRQNLFNEWIVLLNNYREYKTKADMGAQDTKLKNFCVNTIKNLYVQLKHYMDKEMVVSDKDLDDELKSLSDVLFKLKIIDASIESPRDKIILDW